MVAIQILVLTALSAFVLDYGLLWLGRRQAQNAADAGALAGSIALAKDDKTWALMGTNALVTSSARTPPRPTMYWASLRWHCRHFNVRHG